MLPNLNRAPAARRFILSEFYNIRASDTVLINVIFKETFGLPSVKTQFVDEVLHF